MGAEQGDEKTGVIAKPTAKRRQVEPKQQPEVPDWQLLNTSAGLSILHSSVDRSPSDPASS